MNLEVRFELLLLFSLFLGESNLLSPIFLLFRIKFSQLFAMFIIYIT